MPICIGQATRVAEYLLDYEKEYTAVISLGKSTTTQDQTGEVIEELALTEAPTETELEEVIQSFVGRIQQIPPMYSAVKIGGKRLHQLAREGKEIERQPREVQIYHIELLDYNKQLPSPSFKIKVRCSKGTYIRTLGVDIGRKLGFPAHMISLIRSKSGPFSLAQSIDFEELERWSEEDWIQSLYPIDSALLHVPDLTLSEDMIQRIKYGQSLRLHDNVIRDQLYRIYDENRQFVALYTAVNEHTIKPRKVFLE
ncbi:tRNA pseudouridine(55) synthase TruB [Caldalkalibacillus mannanilyticus]|uniref:tRNA pseudouridine(55) synthase TruB n=1 Tax=Caldalkalibacillus mannanilyticus TaxID=1418 RepID=UPI0009E0A162|nr:tRNA pseudouridine(55) synthase TruB [Caldalkalibacillus mannanilyticus]